MEDILDFMYNGSVNLPESRLEVIMRVAEELQIKGLVAANKLRGASSKLFIILFKLS